MKRSQLVVVSCVVAALYGYVGSSQGQDSPAPGDNMKPFSVTDETGFKEGRFRGEVLRLDGNDVVIKSKHGEVRLHRDMTTKTVGVIKKGDMIEVEADDQNHILSMEPYSQRDANETNAGKKKQ
jgi:hypothetical protein